MIEWRVSFTMWPPGAPEPQKVERVTDDEDDAREQMAGLLSMVAPHPQRPCGDHVWEPRLERRETDPAEWTKVVGSTDERK